MKRAGFTEDQRSAWLGHTETISRDHYQIMGNLVTDDDFTRAAHLRVVPKQETDENAERDNRYDIDNRDVNFRRKNTVSI